MGMRLPAGLGFKVEASGGKHLESKESQRQAQPSLKSWSAKLYFMGHKLSLALELGGEFRVEGAT